MSDMKKVGITIDNWKLKIFKKYLKEAGYEFEQHPGLTQFIMLLTVKTDDINKLGKVVKKANDAAARSKMQ